ncbi:Uncharacterized protein Fot_43650 [Forsythia ovata]|uniref:Uncharacterized protein n=1 Tax=Forsythia ovata TaxID=205694 RepID=A0ABD1R250_9LAMI
MPEEKSHCSSLECPPDCARMPLNYATTGQQRLQTTQREELIQEKFYRFEGFSGGRFSRRKTADGEGEENLGAQEFEIKKYQDLQTHLSLMRFLSGIRHKISTFNSSGKFDQLLTFIFYFSCFGMTIQEDEDIDSI